MGLSTKQAASGDHHGIITDLDSQITPSSTRSASSSDDIPTPPPPSVQPHKPPPLQDRQPLKCPRCSSTKTKFCYYNNYNKAQPRHFCKGCKRHWTEGGTLRNVPVGGTRKNNHNNNSKRRRVKTPNDNAAVAIGDQDLLPVFPSLPSDDGCNNFAASFDNLGPSVPPFSLPSCFGYFDPATCCSVPTTNKNAYSDMIIGEFDHAEESTISAAMRFTSSDDTIFPAQQQPWKEQEEMDMATFWSLSDIDSLVSVDLNTAWDDDFLDIKPNGK